MTDDDELIRTIIEGRPLVIVKPKPETKEQERGRTVRQAIAIAIEGLNGEPITWAVEEMFTLREYVLRWVHEYARNRNVILTDADIEEELAAIVAAIHLRGK